ncbi:hypothetical protein J2X72_003055 [Phyllobacterium sp. 1468]|uniref:hypothetical protein n=1 Tax=Phyllobacterium sp. 1468 TaxID=2817759 RepID=UPI0028612760|nr:hypothetical protein [Phyllobacterium sp. 1468]MDR6634245.1 hypothetical protein [Phyllobacterium sp. 1468]
MVSLPSRPEIQIATGAKTGLGRLGQTEIKFLADKLAVGHAFEKLAALKNVEEAADVTTTTEEKSFSN